MKFTLPLLLILFSYNAFSQSCLHLQNGKAYKCEEPTEPTNRSLKSTCAAGNQKVAKLEGRLQKGKCSQKNVIAQCEVPSLKWMTYYYPTKDDTLDDLRFGCSFFKGSKFNVRKKIKK